LVKFEVNYDYDDKKFHLSQGQKLYLYEKTNQDWWLCSHLSEKKSAEKFFVPASYVKDLAETRKFNMKPPPRPPPPPIAVLKQLSAQLGNQDSQDKLPVPVKPTVKPRQIYEKPASANNTEDIYENLSDLTHNSPNGIDNKSEDRNEARSNVSNSPDKIISELDECLDNQEFGFNPNKTNNQSTVWVR
jgi:hypothetical protein